MDATAIPTVATTIGVTAPSVTARPRAATCANDRRTNDRRSKEEAECFGFCGNGGSSNWESCSKHDGYAAQFQLHDASLLFWRVSPHFCSLRIETSNKAQAGISDRLSRDIWRHGESRDRRVTQNAAALDKFALSVTADALGHFGPNPMALSSAATSAASFAGLGN